MSRRRRVGVIGSFVWDVIHGREGRSAPVEEWGGITYALGALDAALADDWEIVPIAKIGHDLAPRAHDFLRSLRRLAPDAALVEVPQRNNRVELRYTSDERRSEILSGGVPPWTWLGLAPLVRDLDALYVNLISGFELDVETALLLRQHVRGPIYLDLHSMLLAVQPDGLRTPRTIPDAPLWCRTADVLQVNEDEMRLLAEDPMALAAVAMREGVRCLCVTLGSRGMVYVAAPGYEGIDVAHWGPSEAPRVSGPLGTVRTALVPAAPTRGDGAGDPTGCGDVWGATQFARLLAGDSFTDAIAAAHRAAARNVDHRGATGLSQYLRGSLHSS
jgi:sugar/nucleoside kinase (ribokinase family)